MANEKPISLKTKEYRKVVKPLLERRRRARINGCLNELRNFILEATKQENSQASKLEKADILEMTVHYLKLLLRQQCMTSSRANVVELGRFKAGYTECANEVSAAVSLMSNVNPQVRGRLLTHLSKCLNQMGSMSVNATPSSSPITPLPSHLSPLTPPSTTYTTPTHNNTHFPHFAPDPRWTSDALPVARCQPELTQRPADWPTNNVVAHTSGSSSVWRPW